MKLSYRISLLFLVSIFLFTFSNSYADSDMLSVTARQGKGINACGYGNYTITATDVFMAGGSSYGGSFHLYATYLYYPADYVQNTLWVVEVYVNDVQVLYKGFSNTKELDEYITAKEGDVVRVNVLIDGVVIVNSINAENVSSTPYVETTVHFGVI